MIALNETRRHHRNTDALRRDDGGGQARARAWAWAESEQRGGRSLPFPAMAGRRVLEDEPSGYALRAATGGDRLLIPGDCGADVRHPAFYHPEQGVWGVPAATSNELNASDP